MILTLFRYISRQVFGTFLMCWAALTALMTLGGGVSNLFKGEGLGAIELAKLFIFFIPPAATFVLPVAAMYAVAMTYGRLALDNELTACRAAGINIHRLFWPAILLGAGVSIATYYSWNFMMPRFFRAAQNLSNIDLGRLAANQLRKNRPLGYKNKFKMHADEVVSFHVDPAEPRRSQVRLRGVAVIELDGNGEAISACSTVEDGLIQADQTRESPAITAELTGMRTFDAKNDRLGGTARQLLGPFEIPMQVKDKLAMRDLPSLRACLQDPLRLADIAAGMVNQRAYVVCGVTYAGLCDSLRAGPITLGGPAGPVEIRCESFARKLKDAGIHMENVVAFRTEGGRRVKFQAGSADLVVVELPDNRGHFEISLDLKNVVQTLDTAADPSAPGATLKKASVAIDHLEVPPPLAAKAREFTDARLLDPAVQLPISNDREHDRAVLLKRVEQRLTQIVALIQFRMTVAVSGILLVVLAALLGVIFRGGHVLTAFGLSCIPGLLVPMAIVGGRNLAEKPDHVTIGLSIMWGVILLLTITTTLVAGKWVRR